MEKGSQEDQHFCLTWNNHRDNFTQAFASYWDKKALTDCIIVCEGQTVRVHKLVLAACSKYFEELVQNATPDQEPLICLTDTKFEDLYSLLEFMYYGEAKVNQGRLETVLATAKVLKIKGLSEVPGVEEKHDLQVLKEFQDVLERKSESKSPDGSIAFPITAEKTAILQAINGLETGLTSREDAGSPGKDFDEEQDLIKVKEEAVEEDEEPEEGKADLVDDDGSDSPKESDLDAKEETQVSPSTEIERNEEAMEAVLDSIVKMDHYVGVMGKPRSHFWRESWSRGVMELISKNAFDIKTASELLGVSYAVLYAKYREQYGYRKPPSAKWKSAGQEGKQEPRTETTRSSPPNSFLDSSGRSFGSVRVRGTRKRNNIDWGSERVRAVCSLIAERQISIKKGSEVLGIDYSTLYYHLARHAPPGSIGGRGGRGRRSSAAAAGGAALAKKPPGRGSGDRGEFGGITFKTGGQANGHGGFVASVSINPAPPSS